MYDGDIEELKRGRQTMVGRIGNLLFVFCPKCKKYVVVPVGEPLVCKDCKTILEEE